MGRAPAPSSAAVLSFSGAAMCRRPQDNFAGLPATCEAHMQRVHVHAVSHVAQDFARLTKILYWG